MLNLVTTTIGIIGGSGFLGLNLSEYFAKKSAKVLKIDKENYKNFLGQDFDVLINANGNSKKFWANQNPVEDYKLTVDSVKNSLKDFNFKLYVYISSNDVYSDPEDPNQTHESITIDHSKLQPYGLHKLIAEDIVKTLPKYLILRCSAMIGKNLKKGVIKDIQDNRDLFVSLDSKLQFITASEVGSVIEMLIQRKLQNETFNCGGSGNVSVSEILQMFNKVLPTISEAQKQVYEINTNKLKSFFDLKTSKQYLEEYLKNIQ